MSTRDEHIDDTASPRASEHAPVLLQPTLAALELAPEDVVLDCTFGRGGHTRAMLGALGPAGRVYALDRDPEAVRHGQRLAREDARLVLSHTAFSGLDAALDALGVAHVNAVLFDLGVSSPQLDDGARGFSFVRNGPLDMRMDPTQGRSAAEWLQDVTPRDLTHVLKTLGEERFAKRITSAIVAARARAPITTTGELAELVASAAPRKEFNKHPATRSFQAIRMAVNDELGQLRTGLEAALKRLASGGRLSIISFHSLEDRIVKSAFRDDPRLDQITKKPIIAGEEELVVNSRAKSAKLRIAARCTG